MNCNHGLRYIGSVNGAFTATSGAIACGNVRRINFGVTLDTSTGYEVAVKPVKSATGTASKSSHAGVVTDGGVYEGIRPAGTQNWWLAYRVYNGATAAAGAAADKYALEKWG